MFNMSQEEYKNAKKQLETLHRQQRAWRKVIERFEQQELDYEEATNASVERLYARNLRARSSE